MPGQLPCTKKVFMRLRENPFLVQFSSNIFGRFFVLCGSSRRNVRMAETFLVALFGI
jgi:hypothetical protein